MKDRKEKNEDTAKYCKGCAWLHIGEKVDHNHCDYTYKDWDELEKRVNGRIEYLNGKLSSHTEQCKYFWDEKLDPNPLENGIHYNAPKSNKCPKIPQEI